MSHTPGPWVIGTYDPSWDAMPVGPQREYGIWRVVMVQDPDDASLIAAAPDLLFALEIILNTTEGIFKDYRENAEKAIKKAKGR